jgi:sensor domain CHASE-containing protein
VPNRTVSRRIAVSEFTWIGGAFVALVLVAYLVLHSTMTGTFDRLESNQARGQAARVATTLGYEKTLAANIISTEAEWDAMDTAILKGQSRSMNSLLPAFEMQGYGLSAVIGLNAAGRSGRVAAATCRCRPASPWRSHAIPC